MVLDILALGSYYITMVFERKKIQTETLGEYLSAIRTNLNISADEVVKKTGMSIKFLNSLESGIFKNLPADVYVFGFLKQIAQLYAIDVEDLIAQYKKEKGIERQIQKQTGLLNYSWYKKIFGKVAITPKFITLTSGVLFVFLSIVYIIWQVWSINRTPNLEIYSPTQNQVLAKSAVDVTGQTDPGMTVTVNGQNVFVENDGKFKTQLGLSQGGAEIIIVASNRFGKSQTKILNITSATAASEEMPKLILKVDFSGSGVFGYIIDNQAKQSLSFNSGDSKTFTAYEKITIETSDAGATKLTLNSENLGSMGKPKEQISDVSFYVQPEVLK